MYRGLNCDRKLQLSEILTEPLNPRLPRHELLMDKAETFRVPSPLSGYPLPFQGTLSPFRVPSPLSGYPLPFPCTHCVLIHSIL